MNVKTDYGCPYCNYINLKNLEPIIRTYSTNITIEFKGICRRCKKISHETKTIYYGDIIHQKLEDT